MTILSELHAAELAAQHAHAQAARANYHLSHANTAAAAGKIAEAAQTINQVAIKLHALQAGLRRPPCQDLAQGGKSDPGRQGTTDV